MILAGMGLTKRYLGHVVELSACFSYPHPQPNFFSILILSPPLCFFSVTLILSLSCSLQDIKDYKLMRLSRDNLEFASPNDKIIFIAGLIFLLLLFFTIVLNSVSIYRKLGLCHFRTGVQKKLDKSICVALGFVCFVLFLFVNSCMCFVLFGWSFFRGGGGGDFSS